MVSWIGVCNSVALRLLSINYTHYLIKDCKLYQNNEDEKKIKILKDSDNIALTRQILGFLKLSTNLLGKSLLYWFGGCEPRGVFVGMVGCTISGYVLIIFFFLC